jgi:hypothetical protein
MYNTRTKTLFTLGASALIVLLVVGIITLIINLQTQDYPEITIDSSPAKATITINNKPAGVGLQKIAPGKVTITASRQGYESQTKTLTLKKGDTQYVGFILTPQSKEAIAEQDTNAEDTVREGISSAINDDLARLTKEKNPIVSELPYLGQGLDFRVDYGLPIDAKRASEGYVAIQISAPTPAARNEALTWMRSIGEDPSNYEIVFSDFKGPIKDSGGILNE